MAEPEHRGTIPDNAWHYEVRRIASGYITYRGMSLIAAATSLVEGTCYGKALTSAEACMRAQSAVGRLR